MKKYTLILALLLVSIGGTLKAQMTFDSYASKSIYSFIRYINWPGNVTNQDFKIAVIGDKPVYDALIQLLGSRSYGAYKYNITFYKKVEEYAGFNHIIFLDAVQTKSISSLTAILGNQQTLLITESPGAIDSGSMINFAQTAGTVKFEIDATNITSKGLNVDPRLVSLAIAAK